MNFRGRDAASVPCLIRRVMMKTCLSRVALIAAALCASPRTQAQDNPVSARAIENEARALELLIADAAKAPDVDAGGKFWIGLLCVAPSDALRTQLELGEGEGLLVEEVRDGGPAAQAGLKTHDVLVRVTTGQGEPSTLTSTHQLVEVVQQAGKSPLKLEVIREGQRQSIEVVAEERPIVAAAQSVTLAHTAGPHLGFRWAGPMFVNVTPPLPPGTKIEFVPAEGAPQRVLVKQGDKSWDVKVDSVASLPASLEVLVEQQLAARQPHPFNVVYSHPPMPVVRRLTALPPNVTLTVTRTGAEPATIVIKRGDQTFEGTENQIDKFPAELRPMILGALGHHPEPLVNRVHAMPVPTYISTLNHVGPRASVAVIQDASTHAGRASKDLETQVRELADQVEKLRKALESIPR